MKRWSIATVMFCILLPLAQGVGCASSKPVVTKVIEFEDDQSWIGRTRTEVESVCGEPNAVREDGEGGSILIYTKMATRNVQEEPPIPTRPAGAVGPLPLMHPLPEPNRTVSEPVSQAEFHVDGAGKVYRYRISPKLVRKGHMKPPPKKR